MGTTSDLRNYLGDDTAKVRFGLFKKIVTVGGKTIEVSQSATNEEVAQALKGSAMTDQLPAVEIAPKAVDGPIGNITGIQSGLFEAKMAELKKKLADRINGGLAKIDKAGENGAAKMDAAVDGIIAKVDKEIEDKLQEFATLTNGGPV